MSLNTLLARKSAFALCLLAIGVVFCCMFWLVGSAEAGQIATVNGSNVNARSGPGTGFAVVGEVNTGEKYPVLDVDGEWYKLQLKEGSAWVTGRFLKLEENKAQSPIISPPASGVDSKIGNAPVCTGVVSATDVNLRFGPGTSYRKLGQVKKGDSFPVLAKSGDWYKLSVSGGTAWIAGWLIEIKNPPQPRPETPKAETPKTEPDGSVSNNDRENGGETGAGSGTETGTGSGTNYGDKTASPDRIALVNATNVNVRSGPGKNYRVIAMVDKGDQYPISGISGEWCCIELERGSGWVAEYLLELPPELSRGGGFDDPGNKTDSGGSVTDGGLSMEVNQLGDRAVITLRSAGKIKQDIFTLTNPNRLVVDLTLENAGTADKDLPASVEINKGPVSTLRTGWLNNDRKCLRLAMDLTDRAHYVATELNNGRELVLEVFVPDIKEYLYGKTIFLDPGHGGSDPGAIGPTGLHESGVTLDIAGQAAELLRDLGATVYLSRTGDSYVGLSERATMANKAKADIFVSVHINSNEMPDKWGMSTYYYSPPGDTVYQAQERKSLANSLQLELSESLRLADLGLHQARFVVLRESAMPAVLLEIGFISNPEEEKLLRDDSFREQAAQAITRGIGYYFCR